MKKLNKFFAVLVALAMMATLCVSMAFAADPAPQGENVDLIKTLTKNAGTTTPNASFVFKIVKNTEKGDSHAVAIADQTFTYPAAEDALTQTKDLDQIIETALASAPNGMYVYDVMEDAAASTQDSTSQDGKTKNTFTYSTKVYRVRVYKSGTTDAPVYKYTVAEVTNYGTEDEDEAKMPVTPGTGEEESTIDVPFENKYVKTNLVDPDGNEPNDDNDAAGLFVQKNVTKDDSGLYADKEFAFTLNATAPAVNTLSETKTGYAYKVMKVKTTGEEEVTAKAGTLVPGTPATVNLKTNERLVFTDLDVGTVINVKEADYSADFNASATLNGASAAIADGVDATASEAGNKLYVTNESKNDTTPEGILISNLPYIALALVAIGGLVAYVVVRRRNADEA